MDRKHRFFVWLSAIFVAALITSDLIGGKFFRVWGLDLSVGMIPFPLTFLLTDIVNEFYGTEGARRITYVGLGVAIFTFAGTRDATKGPPAARYWFSLKPGLLRANTVSSTSGYTAMSSSRSSSGSRSWE